MWGHTLSIPILLTENQIYCPLSGKSSGQHPGKLLNPTSGDMGSAVLQTQPQLQKPPAHEQGKLSQK